ncbi:MAG TPA: cupin domain-containing protein [Thermoanaerobaculia bacterium]|nr:cupin domain-containing protein [Thermoanaerobaculia bacterium]
MDTVYHPIQKDSATFLRTHAQTGGRLTEVRLDIEPGGGNNLHYHARFAEHFAPLVGTIHVQVGKQEHVLRPGDRAVAPAGVPHRWWNPTAEPASVQVELQPGHAGFEEFIRIFYGLATDGRCNAAGVPRSLVEASFALVHGDINLVGRQRVLTPLLFVLHRVALWNGTAQALLRRYCGAPQGAAAGDPAAAT